MTSLLRAEFLKQRTTRTTLAMGVGMLGLVVVAVALHLFGLPVPRLSARSDQLGVFISVGENLGSLFAALLGALAITAEIRYGTIRPTLLAAPQRGRVLTAKAITSLITGAAFGALSTACAAGAGSVFLGIRGVSVQLGAGNYALLIAGGAAAAALWAVIGLGVGAVVRNQAPTMVGILVWVLFVETILIGSIPSVGKYAPAALARAVTGATDATLDAPLLGAALLALYAGAALSLGWAVSTRRDVT